MKQLAVIGGGSWGTALAIALAPRFESVRLWVFEPDLCERMRLTRENDVFLPGVKLPPNVEVGNELAPVIAASDVVLSVMPSHHVRGIYSQMLPQLTPSMTLVSATKGLENGTLLRVSQVIDEVVRPKFVPHVGVFSGPTFAKEVARGEPAAVVISSVDMDLARAVQKAFSGPTLRLYTNSDPVGVEFGAALKNVIAIAAGVCQGLGLGANTTAALITRGLAEISRLALAAGGQARTLAGLAGLGDLVLTCNGDLSRNRQVGIRLGQGQSLAEILASMRMVAEGVQTTYAAVDLAQRLGVDMPISTQMNAVLKLGKPPKEALRDLMERSLKEE
jgi:glycerol-3-phosphate dehydrogenase (NAD(P)+)